MKRDSATSSESPPDDAPIARGGLREQVSERVLTAIFEERFVAGQRLIVQRLSELYRLSPTPVRESLVELAGLGMVELLPNRGAVVKAFGPAELSNMCQVRRVLESEAARSACGKIDVAELRILDTELRRLGALEFNEHRDLLARTADSRLHRLIAASCGNDRLAGEIARYLSLFRALRNVSHRKDSGRGYRHSNDVPEHLEIVKALLADKPKAAADAMDQHIRSVEKTLSEVMFAAAAGNAKAGKTKRPAGGGRGATQRRTY